MPGGSRLARPRRAPPLRRLIPFIPPALDDILSGRRGPLEPPIRSEIFGSGRFAQHGRSLADTHRAERAGWRDGSFFPRLPGNIHMLRKAHRYIGSQAASGYDVSPAAEWLLDNFHLIEAQLLAIHEGLPRSYFRALPVLQDEPLAGLPRIYGLAWAFVAHTDGAFDEDLLVAFLTAYLDVRELNLSEMWALPTTLRVVLIENLRRLAERVATHKAARELAHLCCDRLHGASLPVLDAVLPWLEQRGAGGEFLLQVAQRWQDGLFPVEPAAADWLARVLPDPAATRAQHSAGETADNLSVSNAITSLRAIGDADWPDLVARTSALMRLMLGSPAFAAEAPATRDQSLHAIERLARRSGHSERHVGATLLSLMRTAPAPDAIESVPIHWLRGSGRAQLARALDLHDATRLAGQALGRAAAWPVYALALGLGSVGGVAGWLVQPGALADGVPGAWVALGGLLMLWPVSETVLALIHRLVSESLRPAHRPRWALPEGIPPEHRVLVAIPAMLTDAAGVAGLARRLRLHHLSNPERHAQYALLSDLADSDAPHLPGDDALLAAAIDAIQALNRAHPTPADEPLRFVLLHRHRVFSQSEQCWIGWERKRGKLEQLVHVLATEPTQTTDRPGPFADLGELSRLARATRYLVTLDSDTQLPPGRLRELVGVAAHPYNRPRVDATKRRVIGGYAILQPRIATPLPARGQATLFHALFAGRCGIDPYSAATSEVYQDLFGEGSFSGKGLLDVQAVHAVLGGRLPEDRVLSHDLLEGSIARCAAVTDITVIEEAPFHADVAASRVHRWTRGDWQLLPYLLQHRRFALRAVNRWKMLDNLRRSLVAPAALAWLWLALAGLSVPPWQALAMVFAAYTAGPLMGALAGSSPRRGDVARWHFYAGAAADWARALAGGVWHVAMLVAQSLQALDAVVRALWRLVVSHRRLLAWTTASSAQAALRPGLGATWRRHAGEPMLAAALAVGLWLVDTPWPGLAATLCLLWAASPLWAWCSGQPWPAWRREWLSPGDRAALDSVARDTWRFFERVVGPEDHHLPPDNLQTLPHDMVAHRTSPTNIGLYLLSVACARQFGWIDTLDALKRLEATYATLLTLARYRGHFLNWYDTQTTAALLPQYVSTVDSGNLSGHLLAVAEACREWCGSASALAERLGALGDNFEALAWEAQFGFLYHRKRHLFHIGYRVAEHRLDGGFYDLLASESRLTSVLAIAKGEVPVTHWVALGRPFFAVGTTAGLRSWSGSMFEYLMPTLVLDEPPGSVLRNACRVALREQMAYAHAHHVPWGLSESAYAGRDHTLAYQYAPQGVPRLALRRTPEDELVVAPYATALAAQVSPHRARLNFEALERLSARGACGFIDALDFTPARRAGREPFTPVATFMAHHQGMTLVALANVLLDGVARRWGMANAHLEAVASLLHERAPREVSTLHALPAGPLPQDEVRASPGLVREVLPGATAIEPTQLLSNGRYRVSLRANGAGSSHWGNVGLNRHRDDALRDELGSFFYLRWDRQPRPVSITQHPAPDREATYRASFHADRVCFDATWAEVQAAATVWVSPEDDIEFRQVELHNPGDRALDIDLMSAFEVTLTDPRADEAHPAFSNLFLGAAWQPRLGALVFERRPRRAGEPAVQAAHFLADHDPQIVDLRVQTDRQHWQGRNHAPSRPRASFQLPPAAAATGADIVLDTGLDPVCALCVSLRLQPGSKATLTFATAVSDHDATLRAVIDKYRQPSHVQRASLMSATLAGIRLRSLGLGAAPLALVQSLTTALVFCLTRPPRADAQRPSPADAVCDRSLLWRFGLSGDRPIVLVAAGAIQGLGLLQALAQALRWWAWGGVGCDLVVVNAEPASYQMPLQRALAALRDRHAAEEGTQAGPSGTAMHLLRAEDLGPDDLSTLQGLARLRLHADGRPLAQHVHEWLERHEQAFDGRYAVSTQALGLATDGLTVPLVNGRFDGSSGDFHFEVEAGRRPARPWTNILANPGFGTQLTEGGGGYTWAVNSRLHQLTAWSNDPVADAPSEWLLMQDRRSLQAWSLTPSAWGGDGAVHEVVHGPGHSLVRHTHDELEVTVRWCVDPDNAVKQIRVRVANTGQRTRHLRLVGIVEWQMGAVRADRGTVHAALLRQRLATGHLTALLATQRERSAGFGGGTAFFGAPMQADEADDWTCDRRECFDARGRLVLPDHFGQRSGGGLDPCAALALRLTLAAGETTERVFLMGHGESADAARQLATRSAAEPAMLREERVAAHWNHLLGATTVVTPDPLFNAMVNRWLLYQAVACRLWAKAGFYQAGGATGYRDQLQDAMALGWAEPAMLRAQILLAASRQFVQGDVQHWWHAPTGAGVRTHFSDDRLWLPHACLHYLRCTGDGGLLDVPVRFLDGPPVPAGAEDLYDTPRISDEAASVYEHAARTIDRSLAVGAHGLPLMGSGDWNDGMNQVGHLGRGESVWLGWFLCQLVAGFAPLAQSRGEVERASRWTVAADGWRIALTGPAWDGQWFKRAFFDDGQALGSHVNAEARIDLIAQAWAVLSGVAPIDLQRRAMAAVEVLLVDPDAGLIRLLDPPLVHATPSAGYIQAYPPGVRENGGQYSHAGVWALMARARLAQGEPEGAGGADAVYRDFTWLSPAHRANHPTQGPAYGTEPYVMCGDVYSQSPRVGRGGWSWYTGAAAWLHRAAVESMFGLRLGATELSFQPCLPSHWPVAEMTLRRGALAWRFIFVRALARDALAVAESSHSITDACLLRRGEPMAWAARPGSACFVVPLL